MKTTEVDHEKMDSVLEQINNAEAVVTFFRTAKEGDKFLYSGFGEIEFNLLTNLAQRHIELFDLLKLVVITVEQIRENVINGKFIEMNSVEYLKIKNNLL